MQCEEHRVSCLFLLRFNNQGWCFFIPPIFYQIPIRRNLHSNHKKAGATTPHQVRQILPNIRFLLRYTIEEVNTVPRWPADQANQWYKSQPWLIGCYNWGLVAGKSQTHFNWKTVEKLDELTEQHALLQTGDTIPEPPIWFHDIFRTDGSPFDPNEVDFIRHMTQSNQNNTKK